MNPLDNDLSPEEQALGERLTAATRYRLPAHLVERLEREISTRPVVSPLRRANWSQLAAIAAVALVVVGISFLVGQFVVGPGPVSAAEISRRVDEADRRNLQNGTIVHRVYSIHSTYQGATSDGQHEEWAQVLSSGLITHYKVVQDQTFNGQLSRTNILFIKDQNINEIWSQFNNTVYTSTVGQYQPHLNPIEDSASLLGNTQHATDGTTSRIINSKVDRPDAATYRVTYFYQITDPTNQVSYSRVEFYVDSQSYEVKKLFLIGMQSQNGPDTADKYEADFLSAELLPPDPTRTASIFVLSAPPDAKIVPTGNFDKRFQQLHLAILFRVRTQSTSQSSEWN